jgi:hypothetical protein
MEIMFVFFTEHVYQTIIKQLPTWFKVHSLDHRKTGFEYFHMVRDIFSENNDVNKTKNSCVLHGKTSTVTSTNVQRFLHFGKADGVVSDDLVPLSREAGANTPFNPKKNRYFE